MTLENGNVTISSFAMRTLIIGQRDHPAPSARRTFEKLARSNSVWTYILLGALWFIKTLRCEGLRVRCWFYEEYPSSEDLRIDR